MAKTKIQWATDVWNPVTGCTKVSEGCQNCYAEKMAARLQKMGISKYSKGFEVACHFKEIRREFPGKGKRIFINSMSDLFHDNVPFGFVDCVIRRIFLNEQHTFIILTKRPRRMALFFETYCSSLNNFKHITWPLPNLWLGVTAENQKTADARIPILLETPAAIRFVSVEPMLENIYLERYLPQYDNRPTHPFYRAAYPGMTHEPIKIKGGLDWVICGGESGTDARPVHPDWVRNLRDQCITASVPFFFKQWGTWTPIYDRDIDDPGWRRLPKEISGKTRWLNIVGGQGFHGERVIMVKKMKKKELPELDGKVWNQLPGNFTTEHTENTEGIKG